MAACLLTLRSSGQIEVRSAGSDPADHMNSLAIEAMSELGVDLADAFPKRLTDEAVRVTDVVITMGCGDACPIYPGKRYEDWQVADPSLTSSLDEVRRIRDDIDARVQCLLADLTQTQRGGHVATLSCRATGIRSRRLRSHEDP